MIAKKWKTRVVRSLMRRNEMRRPNLALWVARFAADDDEVQVRQARLIEKEAGANAAAEFLSSLEGAETNIDVVRLRARYLERARDYVNAAELYKWLFERGGCSDVTINRALTRCYTELGMYNLAARHAEYAVVSSPDDPELHENLIALSKDVPLWKKLELLENGLESHQDSLDWHREVAAAAFAMKRWKTALRHYAWCEKHSSDAMYPLKAGVSCWRMNEFTKAQQYWASAVSRDKRNVVQELGAGILLQERGLWSLAAQAYEHKIMNTSQPSAKLLHAAGFAYARQYRWNQALGYLRRATQIDSSDKKYWYDLAFVMERIGKFADAAIAYRVSIDSLSPFSYRKYRLIASLLKAGAEQEAADTLPTFPPQAELGGVALSWNDETLRQELTHAKEMSDSIRCRAVAEAAVNARNDLLANEAFKAAEQRSLEHDPILFVHHAACLYRLGKIREAIEVYLCSKQFGDPHGLNVKSYLKTKAQRDSAVYLDYCQRLRVDDSIVLYESNHGGAITCSVKPILKRMLESDRGNNRLHVVVINDRARVPSDLIGYEDVVFVSKSSDAYLKYLATAGWLVSNNTFPPYFSRREEQRYLNLWHGTPIKTLGKDIKSGMMDHRNATRNFLHVTHLATPNMFTSKVLLERYDVKRIFPGVLAVTGSPRMDTTLNLSVSKRTEIRRRLGVGPNQRVVLYAPTWRGDLANKRVDVGRIAADLNAMKAPDVRVAFRGHPLMEQGLGELQTDAVIVPADLDTNELLGAVDIVISDYSSIAIDSVGAGIRTVLYVYDRAEYESERGLYVDLEELPMEIVTTRAELSAAVAVRDAEVPHDLGALHEIWDHEDGAATDRVISFFFENTDIGQYTMSSERKKKELILFQGHFIPNGVTSSASELLRYLEDEDIGVSLSVDASKVVPFPERKAIFDGLSQSVSVLPFIGPALHTPEEIWLNSIFMSQDELWSPEQMTRLRTAYQREYRRLYGYAQFDAAICFEGYTRYWVLVMASAPDSVRKVVYLHSDMRRETTKRFPYIEGVARVYPWYDVVASVSESANDANFLAYGSRMEPERFCVADNLIDPASIVLASQEMCEPDFDRFVTGHPGDLFISVGRLSVEKNLTELIKAFAKFKRKSDGLVIVGDGSERAKIEILIRALDVENDVYLAGYQANPHKYVARCDVFVLASLFEGQGIVILEALALGRKVVASDVPGPRSVLESGGGVLVPPTASGIEAGVDHIRNGGEIGMFSIDCYINTAKARHREVLGI